MIEVKLKDIAINITDGKHGDCANEEHSGFYFVSCKDVHDGAIHYDNARQITEKDFIDTHKRTMLEPNDILITNSGTIGRMALVKDIPQTYKTTFQKSVAIIKPNQEIVRPSYLYYSLINCVSQFINKSNGSAQKNLLLGTMREFKIKIEDNFDKQDKIDYILSSYDDLIENNKNQIHLLEEAAQRLYKEWFVDLRFPGYEDVELVNGVPEGWKITPINMVTKLKAGGDKPKNFSEKMTNENKIPVFANGITKKGLMGFTDKAVISNPSVTISARGTVGIVFLRTEPYVPIVRLISVTPIEDKVDIFYLYLYLVNQNFRSTGAAQQQITVPLLKSKNIVCPSDDIRKSFNDVITPIFNKIEILEKHINKLTEARDRLLPKLMNGEIEV